MRSIKPHANETPKYITDASRNKWQKIGFQFSRFTFPCYAHTNIVEGKLLFSVKILHYRILTDECFMRLKSIREWPFILTFHYPASKLGSIIYRKKHLKQWNRLCHFQVKCGQLADAFFTSFHKILKSSYKLFASDRLTEEFFLMIYIFL